MSYESIMSTLVEFVTTWGLRVVGVLVALLVGWMIAGWVRKLILRGLGRRKFDLVLSQFAASLVRYAIIIGVGVGCLGVFGIETASFAVVLGAAGLAVGLAFQGTLSNFASGVMLVVFRPFKVGDFVNVGGISGSVEEVDLFTTSLKTPDARRLIVPNSKIFGEVIENFTHHPQRRADVEVGVSYAADIDKARETLEAAVPKIPGVLEDPAPQVFLKGLGASSVDFVVRVWAKTEEFWDVHQSTVRAVKLALDEAEVSIPFPQLDVHLDKDAVDAVAGRRAA